MQEKENVLRILKETRIAFEKRDSARLKELSDQTIHTASIAQDADNIAVAVIVYSLSKIVERKDYQKYSGWKKFYEMFLEEILHTIDALEKGDDKKLKSHLMLIRRNIGKLSGKLKIYIQDVFKQAEINKASRIYEHGISMETTANLLGISMFELAEYAGKTGISDVKLAKTLGVKKRLKLAMEMFE